nr:MAG TPA: hypothetical protein [Caudoviricetes sp.]
MSRKSNSISHYQRIFYIFYSIMSINSNSGLIYYISNNN